MMRNVALRTAAFQPSSPSRAEPMCEGIRFLPDETVRGTLELRQRPERALAGYLAYLEAKETLRERFGAVIGIAESASGTPAVIVRLGFLTEDRTIDEKMYNATKLAGFELVLRTGPATARKYVITEDGGGRTADVTRVVETAASLIELASRLQAPLAPLLVLRPSQPTASG